MLEIIGFFLHKKMTVDKNTDVFEVMVNPQEISLLLRELGSIGGLKTEVIEKDAEEDYEVENNATFSSVEEQTGQVLEDIIEYELSYDNNTTKYSESSMNRNNSNQDFILQDYNDYDMGMPSGDNELDSDVKLDIEQEDIKPQALNENIEDFNNTDFLASAIEHEKGYLYANNYDTKDFLNSHLESEQNNIKSESVKLEYYPPEIIIKDPRHKICKLILHRLNKNDIKKYETTNYKDYKLKLLHSICEIQERKEKFGILSEPMHLENDGWICHFCYHLFKNEKSIRRHVIDLHVGRKDYKCNECEFVSNSMRKCLSRQFKYSFFM